MMLKLHKSIKLPGLTALRKVALFSVGIILVVHSVVPHLHENELTRTESYTAHATANDFLDFIALAFQQDRTHFLDSFLLSKAAASITNQAFELPILLSSSLLLFILNLFFVRRESTLKGKQNTTTQILAGAFGLRAPPEMRIAS